MIESKKFVTYDPFKMKFEKREYITKSIESNITLNLISVSVLPQNAKWSDMEGFVARKYGPFGFTFRNVNEEIIAGMDFYVSYNCRGQFNSAGHYLSEATISPIAVFANKDYYFTCNVTARNPINYGTKADPIAGVILKVQMQVRSYHNLQSNQYNSLENLIESKVLPKSEESVNVPDLTTANDSSIAMEHKAIISSTISQDTKSVAGSDISHPCGSSFYVAEQYLNVIVRGDCTVELICGYGY